MKNNKCNWSRAADAAKVVPPPRWSVQPFSNEICFCVIQKMTITFPLIPRFTTLYTWISALHVRPKSPPALDNILGLYLGYASLINSLDKHICLISSTIPACGITTEGSILWSTARVPQAEHANICVALPQLCMADWRPLS